MSKQFKTHKTRMDEMGKDYERGFNIIASIVLFFIFGMAGFIIWVIVMIMQFFGVV